MAPGASRLPGSAIARAAAFVDLIMLVRWPDAAGEEVTKRTYADRCCEKHICLRSRILISKK